MAKRTPSLSLNILKVLSGRVAVQILGFVTVPVITRLFLPEHFGVMQIFDSMTIIITAITCLKYELSIPLARDDAEALASLALSALIALGVTLLVTLAVAVGKEDIAAWFKAPELQTFLWFLPLVVFIGGLGNALEYWTAREGQFGTIAWSDLGRSLPEKLIQIGWGTLVGMSAAGLFIARLFGASGRIGVLLTLLKQRLTTSLKATKLSFDMLGSVAKRHKKFPLFTTGTGLLNLVSVQLIPFFFGIFFSTTVVGYYSLGYRIIRFPILLLSTSIQKAFFPAAAKEYRQVGSLSNIVSQLFTRLVQIGVFPTAIIIFFGPLLFELMYGQQWRMAGVYAQIFAIWHFIVFINTPLGVFEIVNRQESRLLLTLLMLTGRTTALLIGATTASPITTIYLFVTISMCCALGYFFWQLRLAQVSVWWALKTLGQYAAISGLLLLPVKALSWIMEDLRVTLGMLGLVTVLYGMILMKIDNSSRQFFLTFWGKLQGKYVKPAD